MTHAIPAMPMGSQPVRILSFASLAVVTTISLFWLMSYLVKQEVGFQPEVEDTGPIVVVLEDRDETTNVRQNHLPEPPPIKQQPPRVETQVNQMTDSMEPNFNPGEIEIDTEVSTTAQSGMLDMAGDARPIVRIEPQYPNKAAQEGVEGWVQLSFSISATGEVQNVEIIDAEPKRYFEREARRALRKWKYKPKVVDGVAVEQHNMMVELSFKMEN